MLLRPMKPGLILWKSTELKPNAVSIVHVSLLIRRLHQYHAVTNITLKKTKGKPKHFAIKTLS